MSLIGPADALDPSVAADIAAFVRGSTLGVGHTPIGDEAWLQRATASAGRFAAAWATDDSGAVTAYAQALRSVGDPVWAAEVLVADNERKTLADLGAPLLRRVLDGVAGQGGGHVHYWAAGAGAAEAELALRCGLVAHRRLVQMERPLPLELTSDLTVRAFTSADVANVLEVNRRAFAGHPDQGRMSESMLRERMAEPWFDPQGFLLTEIDGQLAGFCWTKLFVKLVPVLGEIHVICVDPAFGGRRLGWGLVVRGLAYLANSGAERGMLFVEGENAAALELYEGLGFRAVRHDQAYATTVSESLAAISHAH